MYYSSEAHLQIQTEAEALTTDFGKVGPVFSSLFKLSLWWGRKLISQGEWYEYKNNKIVRAGLIFCFGVAAPDV